MCYEVMNQNPERQKRLDLNHGGLDYWTWLNLETKQKKKKDIWIYAFTEVMTATASLLSIAVTFNQ